MITVFRELLRLLDELVNFWIEIQNGALIAHAALVFRLVLI